MNRHIAYDIGAAGVARALGESLNSPVILSNFSRLVIDPNRGEDDPTLVMKLYDGTVIPANRHVDAAEVARRLDRFHRPYHQAYAALAAARDNAVIVAIHSFTPCLRGREPRPWQIGVLHSHVHNSFALRFIERLRRETDLCVGDNEPYSGHLPGDAIDRHALIPRRDNLLIELRNDLIAQPQQQIDWANRLGRLLVDMI
jgi:predicted N-formylglutamate amidohydrolase